MDNSIIVALITAGFPTIATAITATIAGRTNARNAAKDSILQMIMEDHLAVLEGHLPTNYQNIHHEWDIYRENKGNSYVHKKIEEYDIWFAGIEAQIAPTIDKTNKNS